FLIAKKVARIYRLINATIKINSIILRNANIFPFVNEFSEKFIKYFCAFLIDFFFEYDQFTLNVRNKNITVFIILLGFLRMTISFQRAINFIIQFVRIIITILENVFFRIAILFLNDVEIKRLYTNYDNELVFSKIRRFVFEYI
ncbi:hypothetical protein BDZ45DRAFT_600385, partial [Acephala macrosclerotiorum]